MNRLRKIAKYLSIVGLLSVALLVLAPQGQADAPPDLAGVGSSIGTFTEIAPQGFGDPVNNVSWAMIWWNDYLYVGTNRAWYCWSQWSLHVNYPFLYPYPPTDPDMDCADPITDMDLRAEIWRWTPGGTWERVYQSPANVSIPGTSQFTARDVGYRSMGLWTEDDGTEALYVGSVYPKAINPDNYPPPRILRTEDGVNWEAIPQDTGTLMGDYDSASFRGIVTYNDQFFIVAATIQGSGPVWVSENPSAGNNAFAVATPPELDVFEMIPYNGYLYVGTNDPLVPFGADASGETPEDIYGYTVQRTTAEGPLPYQFEMIVDEGAYLEPPSRAVVSMQEYNGMLYVGTDKPAELIRVHPDDSWELIVGSPRNTPLGPMVPLSGYDAGFNWPVYNIHLWRQEVFDGVLFVGTADQSTLDRNIANPPDPSKYGYDLYYTDDGINFYPITVNGMGDMFQMGIRTFATSEDAIYYGTSSFWTGLRVYEMQSSTNASALYLPLVSRGNGSGQTVASSAPASRPTAEAPARDYKMFDSSRPTRLMAEPTTNGTLLSWDAPANAAHFELFRQVVIPDPEHEGYWLPQASEALGSTTDRYFVDERASTDQHLRYFVIAVDGEGHRSQPSNFSGTPLSAPATTVSLLSDRFSAWGIAARPVVEASLLQPLDEVENHIQAGELAEARAQLDGMRARLTANPGLPTWRATDAEVLTHQLERRIWLAQLGLLPAEALTD
ncbi:MAG: hypothetical protein KDD73_09160 [Anaerolineales bacterium]|nr:hypothetical protein [Anaerolineales bacterium]MCB9129185.1 hypothetical protein [Ardenticatenales bacterium]